MEPFLVAPNEAARLLGLSRSSFYGFLKAGRIPLKAVRFGKKRLYDVDQVRAFVKSGCSSQWSAEGGQSG
jgi:excisionase family DNA binding protein